MGRGDCAWQVDSMCALTQAYQVVVITVPAQLLIRHFYHL